MHVNGATGEKLLPETMGGGCAFLDYDSDGDQDILFVNSSAWAGATSTRAGTMALYQNDGRGKFRDVTRAAGLDVSFYGMGVAVGDYDNDGRSDLFISAVGLNHLFRNEGGKFVDVSETAGVSGIPTQWSTSTGFIDYNNDGLLDLFVCNYVQWSREIDLEKNKPVLGLGRIYGPPFVFEGTHPYLYKNDGNGRFTDISEIAGLRRKNSAGKFVSKSLGVAPVDLDNDGWMDLVVANDTVPNQVFHNQENGTFREIGATSGLAHDAFGNVRGAMGIDTAWFGDDASLGIAVANFANEMNAFYIAEPNSLRFMDQAPLTPIGSSSRDLLKFGLLFFDYDLDGWPDLLTANGHLDEDLSKARKERGYAQPAQLFWNGGPKQSTSFVPVTEGHAGRDLFKPIVGRGATYADIDGDGDLDVLLTQIAGPPLLLRNDVKANQGYVRMKLVGTRSNRDAIGARVTLKGAHRIWQAHVMPTRSYLCQSELPITIAFGDQEPPKSMEVKWPSGKVQDVTLPRQHSFTVREPSEP
jgi:enediyne biosynthesis protein E4